MKAIDEMDDPENKPEGLDHAVWERFCVARRAKVESEQLVRKVISLCFVYILIWNMYSNDGKAYYQGPLRLTR